MKIPDPGLRVTPDIHQVLRLSWEKKWRVAVLSLLGLAGMLYWLHYARDSYIATAVVNIGYRVAPEEDPVHSYLEDVNRIEPRLRSKFEPVFRDACSIQATTVDGPRISISCRGATATISNERVATIARHLVGTHDILYDFRRNYRDTQRKADLDLLAEVRAIGNKLRGPKEAATSAALALLMEKDVSLSKKIQVEDTLRTYEKRTEVDPKSVSVTHRPARRVQIIVAGVAVLALGIFAGLAWAAVETLRMSRDEMA